MGERKINFTPLEEMFGIPADNSAHQEEVNKQEQDIIIDIDRMLDWHTTINVPGVKVHPFNRLSEAKQLELCKSIEKNGLISPIILRVDRDRTGYYEVIAGHNRRDAMRKLGHHSLSSQLGQIRVLKDCNDIKATYWMLDSNIQREDILPSEKAKAYAMKYEAMKHQGKKSGKNTLDEVGEAAGENAKKVQRYIWLSRLSEELLIMVDSKKLGFSQGVDISFLTEEAQQWVQAVIEEQGCSVSMVQSGKLKEYGKSGELTFAMVRLILTEEKPKERKITIKSDKIGEYFSDSYSNEEIENIIISLLDKWKEEGAV